MIDAGMLQMVSRSIPVEGFRGAPGGTAPDAFADGPTVEELGR